MKRILIGNDGDTRPMKPEYIIEVGRSQKFEGKKICTNYNIRSNRVES